MTTKTQETPLADKINSHLKAGGVVQITTYLKSTLYKPQHAGMFIARGKETYVKRGRHFDCLTSGGESLVGIRFGHYA